MITFSIDGISIEVHLKKMKNMSLRVCAPQGTVKLSAPLHSSMTSIRRFAEMNIQWIKKHQSACQSQSPEAVYHYHSGERHAFLGQEYVLQVNERLKRSQVHCIDSDYIHIFVSKNSTILHRQKALMQFYRHQLEVKMTQLLPHWEEMIGERVSHCQIRQMKSRWGTCHPVKRNICLNLALIKYPLACLEYVIVHELVHLLEASHNARFKSLMDKFMPDWRARKKLLESN